MKKRFTLFFLCLLLLASLSAQKSEKTVVLISQESGVSVFQKGKILQVQNAVIGEKLEVLSIVGVRVFERRIESSNQEFLLDLPKGYYIVKIGNVVRKISVK